MDKKDFGTRVIVALASHEIAQQRVADLSKRIGAAIERCPIFIKAVEWSAADKSDLYCGNRIKTHLFAAYNTTGEYGEHLEEFEQDDLLSSDDEGCPHCYEAWKLINRRKECRQELGNAKRAIRALGKSAMKHEGLEFSGARI